MVRSLINIILRRNPKPTSKIALEFTSQLERSKRLQEERVAKADKRMASLKKSREAASTEAERAGNAIANLNALFTTTPKETTVTPEEKQELTKED